MCIEQGRVVEGVTAAPAMRTVHAHPACIATHTALLQHLGPIAHEAHPTVATPARMDAGLGPLTPSTPGADWWERPGVRETEMPGTASNAARSAVVRRIVARWARVGQHSLTFPDLPPVSRTRGVRGSGRVSGRGVGLFVVDG